MNKEVLSALDKYIDILSDGLAMKIGWIARDYFAWSITALWGWGILLALGMFVTKESHQKKSVKEIFWVSTGWVYVGKELWERLYFIQRAIERLPDEAERKEQDEDTTV